MVACAVPARPPVAPIAGVASICSCSGLHCPICTRVFLLYEQLNDDNRICVPQDCREVLVWEVVVHWAQHGTCSSGGTGAGLCRNLAEVERVLPLIRFPLMSEADLGAVAVHPLARSCRLLAELVAEARAAHANAARAEELQVRPSPVLPFCPSSTSKVSTVDAARVMLHGKVVGIHTLMSAVMRCVAIHLSTPRGSAEQAKGSSLLVEDARHVRLQASAAEAAVATRFQRRHSPACQELMYVSNGDRNGVCHFLGRACGTQQWVNPVIAGNLKVWHLSTDAKSQCKPPASAVSTAACI